MAEGKTTEKVPVDIASRVAEKILGAENVLVALSKSPDVDEMAAAVGLTLVIDRLGKHGTAIFSGEVPNALEFLQPDKTFEKNTDSLQDFIIALNKEKADHLRYKVDGEYVKVFITPYKTKIDESDLEFSHGDYNVDLVISLNVDSLDELDGALAEHGRILHDATSIDITVEAPGKFGEIQWSDPGASSVSEMVAVIASRLSKESLIDKGIATALLTGIVAATNRFSNERTTPGAMALAGRLMEAGADQQLIASNIPVDGVVMVDGGESTGTSGDPTTLRVDRNSIEARGEGGEEPAPQMKVIEPIEKSEPVREEPAEEVKPVEEKPDEIQIRQEEPTEEAKPVEDGPEKELEQMIEEPKGAETTEPLMDELRKAAEAKGEEIPEITAPEAPTAEAEPVTEMPPVVAPEPTAAPEPVTPPEPVTAPEPVVAPEPPVVAPTVELSVPAEPVPAPEPVKEEGPKDYAKIMEEELAKPLPYELEQNPAAAAAPEVAQGPEENHIPEMDYGAQPSETPEMKAPEMGSGYALDKAPTVVAPISDMMPDAGAPVVGTAGGGEMGIGEQSPSSQVLPPPPPPPMPEPGMFGNGAIGSAQLPPVQGGETPEITKMVTPQGMGDTSAPAPQVQPVMQDQVYKEPVNDPSAFKIPGSS